MPVDSARPRTGCSPRILISQAVATTTAAGYGAFIVSPLTIGLLAQATSLRLALALLIVTSLAIAGLATRWPTASIPPG